MRWPFFKSRSLFPANAIAEEFGAAVETQPWAREIELTDPDGNRLRIGTRPSSYGDR